MAADRTPLLTGMTIVFQSVPLERNLQLQADLGFTGTELWKPHLGPRLGVRMLQAVATHARDLGIALTALNSIGEPYFEPFAGEHAFQTTLDGLKADVDICHALGIPTLAVWEGRARPEKGLDWHLDVLTRLFASALDYAGAQGLEQIVFEPHPFTLGFTLGGIPELCARVGTGHFGAILDTCHLSVAYPRDYLLRLADLVPYVKHLHLGDSDLVTSELHYPPGAGLVDLPACMRALRDGGFAGTMAWDLYSWPFPEHAIRQYRTAITDLVNQLGGQTAGGPRA